MATALTRDGSVWTPTFLQAIDAELCLGCGRCFKVCAQSVLAPIVKPSDDDDDEGMGNTVMSVATPGSCIGCGACGRVCAKQAQTYTEV